MHAPTGMGGFLMMGQQYTAYWHSEVNNADRELMQSDAGDPAFQNEWELLTVWLSLEAFTPWLKQMYATPQVLIRTDNMAALRASSEFKAKSPILTQLAAEISILVEILQLLPLQAEHVPGLVNDIADRLSRLSTSSNKCVPRQLLHATAVEAPDRSKTSFRAWP